MKGHFKLRVSPFKSGGYGSPIPKTLELKFLFLNVFDKMHLVLLLSTPVFTFVKYVNILAK